MASTLPDPSALVPNMAAITGPLFLGINLNWTLLGALGVQAYIYYLRFPKDKPRLKSLVAFWVLLETIQSVLVIRDGFDQYATHFGSLVQFDKVQNSCISVPFMTGLVALSVQLFYAHRLWKLSNSKVVIAVIGLLALTQFAASIWAAVQCHQAALFSKLQELAKVSSALWIVASATCDILIAISMTYVLLQHRTQFKTTNRLIRKLVLFTVETGTLTATCATIQLVLYAALPKDSFFATPAWCTGKIYANSALATLNSRAMFAGPGGRIETINLSGMSSTGGAGGFEGSGTGRSEPLNVSIKTSVVNDRSDYGHGESYPKSSDIDIA